MTFWFIKEYWWLDLLEDSAPALPVEVIVASAELRVCAGGHG